MRARVLRFLALRADVLVTLALVPLFEMLVTIEWSLPYCSNPEDGPAYAVTGMPLPYMRYSGVSSMEFDFMPHVYVLNLALLCLLAFPLVRRVGTLVVRRRALAGGIGMGFFAFVAVGVLCAVHAGVLRPALAFGDSDYGEYTELRPVALRLASSNHDCKPSPYWFPKGWHGR